MQSWAPFSIFLTSTLAFAQSGTFTPGAVTGCPTPPPTLSVANTPDLGVVARFVVADLPASTLACALFFGTQATDVPLDSIGATGCRLLAGGSPTSVPMQLSAGALAADLDLSIPSSAALLGSSFECQAAAISPGANPLGLALSHAGRLTIGQRLPLPVAAGLVAHFDATDPLGDGTLPLDGSDLMTWRDISGLQHDATASPMPPIYRRNAISDRPAVDFTRRTNDGLATAVSASLDDADWTVFLVASQPSTALFSMAEPNSISHEVLLFARAGPTVRALHHTAPGNWFELPHQLMSPGAFIQEATFDQATTAITNAIDGVPSNLAGFQVGAPSPFPNSVPRAIHLGRRGSTQFENGSAYIAEVLVYDRILTASERAAVGAHLSRKYEIPTAYP